MNNKQFPIILSILLALGLALNPVLQVGARSIVNDGTSENNLQDISMSFSKKSYISEDEKTLIAANPPRILVPDPNPEMQNLHFPRSPWIEEAISGRSTPSATFDITYKPAGTQDLWGTNCSTFPEEAKTACNGAANIWANLIQSSVPITISACWSGELETGVLGYSGVAVVHRDFPGAPKVNTWYKPSLANSFAGTDLESTYADMYITYSSTFDWYYGTDGMTPSGLYDLVTVAAHEIAHGLNFSGMMAYSVGTAQYGYDGYPSIYETFIESGGGTKLTSYTNPSTALGTLVTSNDLWWDGPNANAANGGGRVKIFAPSTWMSGSSYSHLDYDTFAGTINSMMVYQIGSGSSQHNPGPVTQGLLMDMGWEIGTTTEPPLSPTGLSATDGAYTNKVRLTWNTSTGANRYEIYRNTSNSHTGETLLTGSQTSTSYDDYGVTQDVPYYYWVKACNSAGCSDYSSVESGYSTSEVTVNMVFLPIIMTPPKLLINGDFEQGHVGWTEYSSHGWDIITPSAPVSAHSGSWLS